MTPLHVVIAGVGPHPLVADVAGVHLAVDVRLAHAPGDELGHLRSEIENENGLMCHGVGGVRSRKDRGPRVAAIIAGCPILRPLDVVAPSPSWWLRSRSAAARRRLSVRSRPVPRSSLLSGGALDVRWATSPDAALAAAPGFDEHTAYVPTRDGSAHGARPRDRRAALAGGGVDNVCARRRRRPRLCRRTGRRARAGGRYRRCHMAARAARHRRRAAVLGHRVAHPLVRGRRSGGLPRRRRRGGCGGWRSAR